MPTEPFAHILITKAVMRHLSIKNASLNCRVAKKCLDRFGLRMENAWLEIELALSHRM